MTEDQQRALDEYRAAALSAKFASTAALNSGLDVTLLMAEAARIQSEPLPTDTPPLVTCPDCGTHLVYSPAYSPEARNTSA